MLRPVLGPLTFGLDLWPLEIRGKCKKTDKRCNSISVNLEPLSLTKLSNGVEIFLAKFFDLNLGSYQKKFPKLWFPLEWYWFLKIFFNIFLKQSHIVFFSW